MRILDRYVVRQLVPVWLWCIAVFLFLSCLIDLFEHLDDILRYRIATSTVIEYYLNFLPMVYVKASPLALLLAAAFVGSRLSRYQELLAMNASGTSLLRASVPFLFIGWLASCLAFVINDQIVPATSLRYEQLRIEAFHSTTDKNIIENVAAMDSFNRLYHARQLLVDEQELTDLTVLEHDANNQPVKSLQASRAIWTKHGWLLLYGRIYRVGPRGVLRGEPQPFVERLISYPVTPLSFSQPETRPEAMRYGQLRLMIKRLKRMGMKNLRRYTVELAAKITLPLMNLLVCLLAFAGSTQLQLRGHLRGLGQSLGWGMLYYLGVGLGEGIGKKGLFFLPAAVGVWAPHLTALWWCLRVIRKAP